MNLQEQVQHYKAVKARIAGAHPIMQLPAPEKQQQEKTDKPEQPLKRKLVVPELKNLPLSDENRRSLILMLEAYQVTWWDIVGPCRMARFIPPRRAIYWMLHCKGFSMSRIGRLMMRDHSSIVYAIQAINSWNRKTS